MAVMDVAVPRVIKVINDESTSDNRVFCTLCSTYIMESNSEKIVFRKGTTPVVVCRWCAKKIMEATK